jgi:hypothetical protein
MGDVEPRSEQAESLELADESDDAEDSPTWVSQQPDYAREPDSEEPGEQLVEPENGTMVSDREPDQVAERVAPWQAAGPENRALEVEQER